MCIYALRTTGCVWLVRFGGRSLCHRALTTTKPLTSFSLLSIALSLRPQWGDADCQASSSSTDFKALGFACTSPHLHLHLHLHLPPPPRPWLPFPC
jgi:hypothetical protein